MARRLLTNNIKRVGGCPELCGTPLFVGLGEDQRPYAVTETEWPEKKLEIQV